MLSNYSTKELTEELVRREGIKKFSLDADRNTILSTNGSVELIEGPAVIIVNQD